MSGNAGKASPKLESQALLIDLDGTLVDSSEAFYEAARKTLRRFGSDYGTDEVGMDIARRLQLNLPLEECLDNAGVDEVSRKRFLEVFLQHFYEVAPKKTRLLPNVGNTLRRFSKNLSLALVTRRFMSTKLVREELKRLRVDRYFATVVTSLEVERPTPSPDAILKAAEELRVQVRKCVMVSDSGVDIRAGRAAGAKTVAVLSGLFNKEELRKEKPDLILKSINDLPKHVLAV